MAVRNRLRFTIFSSLFLIAIILLGISSYRKGHHEIMLEYVKQQAKLRTLQALYPDRNYTPENYTAWDEMFVDPGSEFNSDESVPLPSDSHFVELESEVSSYQRANASFFSLVRNEELYSLLESITHVETRFNQRYHYDWIFANDEPFTETFKREVQNLVSGNCTFVTIPEEYWSYPDFIDQDKARATRERMTKAGIIYGGSESYRHMCRFNSGFFYKLDAFKGIKYYWRVEPDIQFNCDLPFDYFKYMEDNDLKYGFTMALHELAYTINGLFDATKEFFNELHPEYVSKNNHIDFISQDEQQSYNLCHYWSNFELGDLDFLRSKEYNEYFDHLDSKGGFFYERWGDAPIHTLAVSYLLTKNETHYFDNTGYYHVPHTQCPTLVKDRMDYHCICQPSSDFNWGNVDSCVPLYHDTKGMKRPDRYTAMVYLTDRKPVVRVEINVDGKNVLVSDPQDPAAHSPEADGGDSSYNGFIV
ncbi:hypothetical protein WICPIJ_002247 [Wickerhamomyces pijperi]|uniref:Glycosyltransferase family 15 protein n=1 Tax=Wickerhamomyces pijperi TaxID=599730 RepID=A0A9P8Q9G8_WICPI|nr:hypothetical protein WICPIJ_002247 [Wickerhamomyces pijperi]